MKEAIYFNPLTLEIVTGHITDESLLARRGRYGWAAIEEHPVNADDVFVVENGALVKKSRVAELGKRRQAGQVKLKQVADRLKNKLNLSDDDMDDLKAFFKGGK